jgi:hypothetical protein
MKKSYILSLLFLFAAGLLSYSQTTDPLVSNCVINAGTDAKYLKDFRVQLGKSASPSELRFKAKISLWKSTKYRFSMCNSDDSKGKLILNIKDEADKVILSSLDKSTGKTYPYIDFICNKSGIYQLNYDFTDGQQGSGVGVVSMIK